MRLLMSPGDVRQANTAPPLASGASAGMSSGSFTLIAEATCSPFVGQPGAKLPLRRTRAAYSPRDPDLVSLHAMIAPPLPSETIAGAFWSPVALHSDRYNLLSVAGSYE